MKTRRENRAGDLFRLSMFRYCGVSLTLEDVKLHPQVKRKLIDHLITCSIVEVRQSLNIQRCSDIQTSVMQLLTAKRHTVLQLNSNRIIIIVMLYGCHAFCYLN